MSFSCIQVETIGQCENYREKNPFKKNLKSCKWISLAYTNLDCRNNRKMRKYNSNTYWRKKNVTSPANNFILHVCKTTKKCKQKIEKVHKSSIKVEVHGKNILLKKSKNKWNLTGRIFFFHFKDFFLLKIIKYVCGRKYRNVLN